MLRFARGLVALAACLAFAAHVARADAVKVGALQIETSWLRATPGGAKVAAGYLRITNNGSVPDTLISASMPLAGRGEVHEMSMQNGVMHMRALPQGLAIAPGQTVELKPGSFHLMFLDLNGGLSQGQSAEVTLRFEKAGTVRVTFSVGGLGSAPPQASH
jgi:copper(I)-binding protein